MEPSDLISGRYRLGEPIGRGGMATIYRATDEHMMDRPVAVKVLREVYSSDPKFVTRFQREARAASALQHPNIVQVFDYGQSGDAYYIVMEFIDGMDLRRYLKRRGVLPIERGVQIARDVALGLGAAHRRGIVHRDVKPQNIMLNDEGVVKLTDFGIASMYKDADAERLTTTGMTLGTVQYYAPEQAQGEIVRPSADIYALGIVMYEMLTGQTPFDGDTPVAVAMKHIQEIPEPPSALNPRIPPALERIIMRCLEKDPQARFRDGDTLAAALDNFLRAPARRPGVASGANEAIGGFGPYGASNPNMARSGVASGPRPAGYPGGQTPTSGPRSGPRGPMSVNGRPGVGMGGMADDPTYDDLGGPYGQRGGFNDMGAPPQGPVNPTRPWDTPDGTKPRWPGTQPPAPPKRNVALIASTIAAAVVLLVVGCFLAFSLTNGLNLFGASTPTVTPIPNETVPNIVGMTCDEATTQLTTTHLTLNCTAVASTKPVNQIIAQSPAAGSILKAGQVVQAQYSNGQGTEPIPQLANKSSGDACNLLQTIQLTCQFQLQYSSSVLSGNVIKSDPVAGSMVKPGTTVILYVSQGPQPTATIAPTATASPTPTCVPVTPTPTPGGSGC
ncbi:MAG TPA: protein kinase [Ktedonobacterales bacterium]